MIAEKTSDLSYPSVMVNRNIETKAPKRNNQNDTSDNFLAKLLSKQ